MLLFLLVGVEAGFGGLTRPLHMSLLPWLARTPGELVASNIASSAAEGLGTLLGPAIAGVCLAASGVIGATAATAGLMSIAVLAVATIHVAMIRTSRAASHGRVGRSAGIRVLRETRAVQLVLLDLGLQTFVRGMLTILLVVAAIEQLGMGEPGVGALNAALGAGGFVGALVALSLTGRRRFSQTFAIALALWGLPIAVVAIVTHPIAAVGMLAIVGMSNAILDVTGFTMLQRATPNDGRVGVMGMVDSLAGGMAALGGVVGSLALAALGIQGALVVAGAILPLAALITLPALRRAESGGATHEVEARLLHADPLLSPLSLSIVEELAGVLRPVAFEAGASLIREGDPGSQYLIIADGEVEVSRGGQFLQRVGSGSGVGEIALLRDVPRTATVRAIGAVHAFVLERDAFLAAVTGQPASQAAAETIVHDRLARTPAPPAT